MGIMYGDIQNLEEGFKTDILGLHCQYHACLIINITGETDHNHSLYKVI
jgi:hypothetical protein